MHNDNTDGGANAGSGGFTRSYLRPLGGQTRRELRFGLFSLGFLILSALQGVAAPPLVQSANRNVFWPDSLVTNQPWWTSYTNTASFASNPVVGFAAIGGAGTETATSLEAAIPTIGTNLVIAMSSFAEPIVGIGANFQLGDALTPPVNVNSNLTPVLDFLGGPTNAVWLNYAGQLIASDMGAVQVSWALMNGTTQTITYTVSPNPTRRPVRLYWTEGQNAGPTIAFASTYRVDIFYNSQIRGTNDVWIESNQLRAAPSCGTGGRFLLTYSRVDEGTGKRELLAYEIVEVLQPMSSVRYAQVGDRLLPQERPYGTDSLFATITRGVIDPAGLETPYVYQHTVGTKKGWVWAIRETPLNEPWRIEIYWKAKEELDVLWPFEVDIYDVKWGSNAQLFVRGEPGDPLPKVYFPPALQVELLPHTQPATHQPVLKNGALYTVDEGYCLLKYATGNDVWFEPVRSISHNDPHFGTTPTEWSIPRELRPVDTNGVLVEDDYGEWPGYLYTNDVASGRAYNIGKYRYPAGYMDVEDANSYVFPVNTGPLEVWWGNRSRQDNMPQPIFFPSLANRYQCDWPPQPREIAIASGLGNTGYTEDRQLSCIRFDRNGMPLEEAQYFGCHLNRTSPNGLAMTSQFTLELWLKPDALSGMQYLIDKGSNYRLRLNGAVPELYAGGRWYRATTGLTTDWRHLAVTVASRGAVTFYLDGLEVGSSPFTGSLASDSSPFRLGAHASDGVTPEDFYSGAMDEVRVWSVARTATLIRDHMSISVSSRDRGLCARYRFDAEEQVRDLSDFGNHLDLPEAGVAFEAAGVSQVLPGLDLSGVTIGLYAQSDRAVDGYNPNEEHAIIFQSTVYALRCDLNITNGAGYTSEPFVLVDCQSPLTLDNRPYMEAFRVVPSNSVYKFERFLTAGLMIQPPLPLSLMVPSNCSSNKQVAGPRFRDRKGYYWAKQAGDRGGTTNYVFDLFYPMQSSFDFPGLAVAPEQGAQIPWLQELAGDGTPQDFTYIVEWPVDLPVLHIGATLTTARDRLPAIRGQLSVEVPYQQSAVLNPGKLSVTLIDPTAARKAPMNDVKLVTQTMKSYRDLHTACWHFSDLSPALRSRLFYNPNAASNTALQLTGEYRTRTDNHNYLLLNLLAGTNRAASINESLVRGIEGEGGDPWRAGIAALPATVLEITANTTPFDSLALPTTGLGTGYVTVVFNNSPNTEMVDPSENIDMVIFRVDAELYRGQLDVIQSVNPLDKLISVYYTADFRGTPERWEFKWEYADPQNGSAPSEANASLWHNYAIGPGLHYTTVGDAGVFGLSDHYLRCSYRALDPAVSAVVGTNWAAWTQPVLCEGWIKRVLKAINPFDQRIRDFLNYEVLTELSMLQQIGKPYDGDIPLNYEALNEFGLMQIYETLNEQADKLSVEAGFQADGSLALALLMVKGRLSDLYMVLGHEAYGDALDPTLSLGADDPVGSGEAPSLFCFQNQVPDLLSEELALLRGRDDSMNPLVSQYPLYNRLPWNITADIIGGQVAYMLNYGISDLKGNQNGVLDADDAMALFPQGHGDAYGHYLSALKGYYAYLHNPFFSWYPQVEGLLVKDVEVTVSYLHEKKFAVAAAARARAGLAAVEATRRAAYTGEDGWMTGRDSDTNRAWGTAEWGSRVGMGAYFDWLTANSLLPSDDTDPTHSGIKIIHRSNIPELPELVELGNRVQQQVDFADAGLNPLGLAPDAVPFDISSAEIDAGKTHFEQAYDRALTALQNAVSVRSRIKTSAQAIRDQNEAADLDTNIQTEEARITRRLLEVYGYPYSDDIGPGKLYPQGYNGPDLLHCLYVDHSTIGLVIPADTKKVTYSLVQDYWQIQTNTLDLTGGGSITVTVQQMFDVVTNVINLVDQYATNDTDTASATNGTDGTSGTNTTGGTSGTNTTGGTSGTNVTDGTSGTNTTGGTSGTNVTGGTSGTNTTGGTSGTNVTGGTSGTNTTGGTTGTNTNSKTIDISLAGRTIDISVNAETNEPAGDPPAEEEKDDKDEEEKAEDEDEDEKVKIGATIDVPWIADLGITFSFGDFVRQYEVVSVERLPSQIFTLELNVANNGLPVKPDSYTGTRRAEGEIQMALSEYLAAKSDLDEAVRLAQSIATELRREGERALADAKYRADMEDWKAAASEETSGLEKAVHQIEEASKAIQMADTIYSLITDAGVESMPTVVGLASDVTSAARGFLKSMFGSVNATTETLVKAGEMTVSLLQMMIDSINESMEAGLTQLGSWHEQHLEALRMVTIMEKERDALLGLTAQWQRLETARMRLSAAINEGDQLQMERERLRMNWAADLSTKRYRNMAYRLFQNDEQIRYQQSFDLAARYVFLAAKAYDYETGLLESDASHTAGRTFMRQIVKARSLGRFTDGTQANPGEPLVGGPVGDPGLADAMARMKANWGVLKGRLSFNNPQQEAGRFSLRQELYRISTNAASDANWKATLTAHKVANLRDLPAFMRYCLPFDPMQQTEPAIVIPFATTVDFRRNFFGHLLAGGDNAYDSTHFATKIRSVGVWFGNFDAAFQGGLANQPRVYLVPAGVDSMRVPIGRETRTRQWSVVDQALPIPYPINQADWEDPDWSLLENVLGNDLYRIRKFPSMLAYHDSGEADAQLQVTWNSRLVGRSVWNSQWVLIIPGGTLLSDADEGIERFINGRKLPSGARDGNGVRDIKLYFHTYSYSGN
jgi:hypothetical protein